MKIERYYFESGKFAGWLIFWHRYKYRTYIHIERGWRGHYPCGIPRLRPLHAGFPLWHGGSLMLLDRRVCWKTELWITGPEDYTIASEDVADNLYEDPP